MNRFDGLTLSIPERAFDDISDYLLNGTKDGGDIYRDLKEKNVKGLKTIKTFFTYEPHRINIPFTGKILEEKYRDKIHKDNFNLVYDKLNKCRYYKLNYHKFLELSTVNSLDVTMDLEVEKNYGRSPAEYILVLNKLIRKYNIEVIKFSDTSIRFMTSRQEKNILGKFYDKAVEINLDGNEDLRKLLPPGSFQGILRPEFVIQTHRDIKRFSEIETAGPPLLIDVLESKANILKNVFNNFFWGKSFSEPMPLYTEFPNQRTAEKFALFEEVYKYAGTDITAARRYYQKRIPYGNSGKFINEYTGFLIARKEAVQLTTNIYLKELIKMIDDEFNK